MRRFPASIQPIFDHRRRRDHNDAAWTYPQPKPAAKEIAGYVAFWRGVTVSDD
jgi:uncharacterized protein (DUF427 family)